MRRFVLIAGLISVVAILGVGTYAYLELTGRLAGKSTPEALRALLEPDMTIVRPDEGEGPFPAVVLLHGCNGLWDGEERRRIMDVYADIAASEGVVAIIVDSYRPRGIREPAEIAKVCSGRRLRGGERAGDAAVALSVARSLPYVDEERLALAGWSHGGWTVMDLLAMSPERMRPYSLTRWQDAGLDGLVGVYLTYPYCGFPALAPYVGFARTPAIRAIHGAKDTTADPRRCAEAYARAERTNFASDVIPEAEHGFDEPANRNYDPDQAEIGHARFREFLQEVVIPGST